jgi:phenylpropionate dioxygenase-like ring-hydroxylating dioxygenase large terminal subunit
MLDQVTNESLTQTDAGTPMGDLMRRYWQPVGISEELPFGGEPREIRVMGEDLVLFRDDQGEPGLLALHCSHRGTSLAYGRVEDGGIRCPFHGWLYDREGNVLEQPAELDGGAYRGHLRHPSYPCEELGGMIFAYLGPPEHKPLVPRYEVLVRKDGAPKVDYYHINSNFIQNVVGALDTVHFSYLHMDRWSQVKHKLVDLPKPQLEFLESDYGIWQRACLPNVNSLTVDTVYAHFFMPAGFVRIQASGRPADRGLVQKFYSWYVPADDTHTVRFQAAFSPPRHDGTPFAWPHQPEPFTPPGPENRYYRNYAGVDTISGIPVNAPGTAIKGYLCQDNMVNESQGPVVDREHEHLTPQDKVLMLMRQIYFKSVEEMRAGRDPKHILRNPADNNEYHVHGTEEIELV